MSLADQRPEAVEECVRPLFRQTRPPPNITNVSARNPPTGLFPRLGDNEESVYETISDVISRSKLPESRVSGKGLDVDSEHVYDNIDDYLLTSSTDIHQIPPPLPPPPLPARRPTASHEIPLCRSEVVELDSHHIYTIADVLDSFEALAAHLPQAKRFIYDLQLAAYLHRQRQTEQTTECDDGHRAAKDAKGRWTAAAAMNRGSSKHQWAGGAAEKRSTWGNGPAQRRLRQSAAMYSSDDSQPIVVEDYVCSPGNHLSSARPHRAADKTSTTTNSTHGDGLYVPMKPGSKASAPTTSCCGSRGSAAVEGRPPSNCLITANEARKPTQPTKKTGKRSSRVSTTLSSSITELDRRDDVVHPENGRAGRRSSRLFQMPPSYIDATSYMLENSQLPSAGIARHQKALSRSLMDGISHQPSRPISGKFADRKQKSHMTTSSIADDKAARHSSILHEMSSNDLAARPTYYIPRSASEDRYTGSGNCSVRVRSPTAVGDKRRPNNKSSHRSRAAGRTPADLSRSLMATSTVPHHPTSSGAPASSSMSFHEVPPQHDRRRSSILQWTATSCSKREIFC